MKYAITIHAYNLFKEFDCVGIKSQEEQKVNSRDLTQKLQLPAGWRQANSHTVEFTYVHAQQQNKFIKMSIVLQDQTTINVTFRISERNPGIMAQADEVINIMLKIDENEFE